MSTSVTQTIYIYIYNYLDDPSRVWNYYPKWFLHVSISERNRVISKRRMLLFLYSTNNTHYRERKNEQMAGGNI